MVRIINKKLFNKSFLNSKLDKFIAIKSKFEKCNFWETKLTNSKFLNSKINKSIFTDANLSNASFLNSEIKNTNFTHANLRGIDFKTSKLINVNLRDAVFDDNTTWPKNFNPTKYGAIEYKKFNPFSYLRKLSYNNIKSLTLKELKEYKKKIENKKEILKPNKLEKKILYELTKGKGYIILKDFFNKKIINHAEKIINQKLKKHKNYKMAKYNYEIDKMNKSINFFDLLNTHDIFRELIQPKIVMNSFKQLLGENFICTYYAAQCSLAGSRGQSLHLDYPYVVYNKPGDKIPMGMGSTNHLLSCGILTYLNNSSSNSYGPIVLRGSQKYRRFPTVQDVKKYKFTKLKVPKGGMVILNTLMWHAGAPNYSDKNDRSVLVTHYTPNYVRLRMDLKNTTNRKVIEKDKKKNGLLSQLLT